jgi:hypothetical protein
MRRMRSRWEQVSIRKVRIARSVREWMPMHVCVRRVRAFRERVIRGRRQDAMRSDGNGCSRDSRSMLAIASSADL